MSSISLLTNEYLYEFKLFFRKTIPKNEAFYIVLFFTKFFPIILFTHSIDPNSHNYPKLFTLSKIIRALVIFNHAPQFSYITLCIILYVLLSTFMISRCKISNYMNIMATELPHSTIGKSLL